MGVASSSTTSASASVSSGWPTMMGSSPLAAFCFNTSAVWGMGSMASSSTTGLRDNRRGFGLGRSFFLRGSVFRAVLYWTALR